MRSWRAWSLGTTREICRSHELVLLHGEATHLDLRIVGYRRLAVLGGHSDLKHTIFVLHHWSRVPIPIVEVANKESSEGIGRPFAVYDVAILLNVEAKLLIPLLTVNTSYCAYMYAILPL
jgi:hypothetical protein